MGTNEVRKFGIGGFASPGGAIRSATFYQELLLSRRILDDVVETSVELVTPAGTTTVDLAQYFASRQQTDEPKPAATRAALASAVSL